MSTIVITGGTGFLGKHLCKQYEDSGHEIVPLGSDTNLIDPFFAREMYQKYNPKVVIHLAASVGGIGANQKSPADFFYKNIMMGINVIHWGMMYKVPKIVIAGTICAYPKFAKIPFVEEDLWSGYPEETNAPYGIAKKSLLVMAQAYREQYGLNTVYLLPVNLYGPGDNFNENTSHVIPALIKKIVHAKMTGQTVVKLWGTGRASREFLYVEDAARAFALAAQKYDKAMPLNIGTGDEINIVDLAQKIANIVKWDGSFEFQTDKPDGQPRRCLDTIKASQELGFTARTKLDEGLFVTIDWYIKNVYSDV